MIQTLPAHDIPMSPPTHFEIGDILSVQDTWSNSKDYIQWANIARESLETPSSSSRPGTIENMSELWLEFGSFTSSDEPAAEFLADYVRAEKRAASVKVFKPTENLFELRRLTGFTWERLADILNVDRRTLYNWLKGCQIRENNRSHIASTLALLRYVDRGSAQENAQALNEESPIGGTCFEAIKAGRFGDVRERLSHGRSRASPGQGKWAPSSDPRWGLVTMYIHEAAEADDTIEDLPDEPMPASRPRQMKPG